MSKTIKKVGVLTSGGDSPGMNAAIRSVVRTCAYHNIECIGIYRGYQGMIEGDFKEMGPRSVNNIVNKGGTILKSARSTEFRTPEGRKRAHDNLVKAGVDALVVIGGDGSFTGGLIFNSEFDFPVMGIPGTIDNDIPGTDFTSGFDTAANVAMEALDRINDTATSHQRVFVVEVMGRGAGDIALWSGIATGADAIVIPEREYDIEAIANKISENRKNGKDHGLIVLAEGVMGAAEFKEKLDQYGDFDSRAITLGHIQRGGSPTVKDRVLATRLGDYAIRLLLEGKGGLAIGIHDNQLVATDIIDTLENHKHQTDVSLQDLNDRVRF